MKNNLFKKHISLLLVLLANCIVFANAPTGYYDASDGKSGEELKTMMHKIIRKSLNMDYDGYSAVYWGNNYFKKCDWNSSGYFWDMYSNIQRAEYNSTQLAREHCLPRSWWGNISDYGEANSDLNNLFPADFSANGRKSNLPLGEIIVPTWTNDVVKVGPNTFPGGYVGNVFEPADEYKGDFARTYFYMATCYEDYATRWKDDGIKSMLKNETYPVFQDWAIEMLLKWSTQDPVSQKEINRNDSVFSLQQNRNPFIDFPILAEHIWGSRKEQAILIENKASQPTLITPASEFTLNFGEVLTSRVRVRNIPLRGVLFNNPITIDFEGNASGYFSAESEIAAEIVNQAEGYSLPITYTPKAQGTHTAKLRISSIDLAEPIIIKLNGVGVAKTENPPVEPTEDMDVMIFYAGSWAKESLPSNFETNAAGAPYVNGDFSFRNTKEYLTVSFDEIPDILQLAIYPRSVWGSNNNHLYIYEAVDKNSFSTEYTADFDKTFVVNNTYNNTPQVTLNATTRAIKIEYIKQAQNVGINNLIITRKKDTDGVNYILADTFTITVSDGYIYIDNLNLDDTITIYNVSGYILSQQKVTSEQMAIPFNHQGLFLLKTNKGIRKFIVQ